MATGETVNWMRFRIEIILDYTTTFLAENLSLSRKTVSLRLKMLKEAGFIERIGSDRKGYWKLLK